MATKQMNEVEHIEQLADSVAQYDLDKFTQTPSGRRYGEPYSFKKGASKDLMYAYRDLMNKGRVARMTHPQATYLTQLVAKDYKVPLEVRSVDTAMEAHHVDRDIEIRKNYWEHDRELLFRVADAVWVLPHPKVLLHEGRLVYDIKDSINNRVRIERGAQIAEASEESIEGGIKLDGEGDLFAQFRKAKILRDHDVKLTGGEAYFNDTNYPNIASVWSDSDWGDGRLFYADADGPSYRSDGGLVVPEIVGKS